MRRVGLNLLRTMYPMHTIKSAKNASTALEKPRCGSVSKQPTALGKSFAKHTLHTINAPLCKIPAPATPPSRLLTHYANAQTKFATTSTEGTTRKTGSGSIVE